MYLLVNWSNNNAYTCEDEFWISALQLAKQNGWDPLGTKFDLLYAIDDTIDETDDFLMKLFTVLSINHRFLEWNGDYLGKENQLVTESDAKNLSNALQSTSIDRKFINFLHEGSFRIRSI